MAPQVIQLLMGNCTRMLDANTIRAIASTAAETCEVFIRFKVLSVLSCAPLNLGSITWRPKLHRLGRRLWKVECFPWRIFAVLDGADEKYHGNAQRQCIANFSAMRSARGAALTPGKFDKRFSSKRCPHQIFLFAMMSLK